MTYRIKPPPPPLNAPPGLTPTTHFEGFPNLNALGVNQREYIWYIYVVHNIILQYA